MRRRLLLRRVRRRTLRGRRLPVRGRGLRGRRRLLLLRLRAPIPPERAALVCANPAGCSSDEQSCAAAGACCALACAGGVLWRRGLRGRRAALRGGGGLLQRRVHGRHVRADAGLSARGRAVRQERRMLWPHLRATRREQRPGLSASDRVSRRRRDVRDRRHLLQRPLHEHAGRRRALPGAPRLPAGAAAVHGQTRTAARACARRRRTARTAACARPAASRSRSAARPARRAAPVVCNVVPEGVGRCAKASRAMADHCRVLGELCMKADECCAGARCAADAAGRKRCLPAASGCSAAGYPCSVAEQCCGGRCLPDGAGGFACRDACAPAGAACSATR